MTATEKSAADGNIRANQATLVRPIVVSPDDVEWFQWMRHALNNEYK